MDHLSNKFGDVSTREIVLNPTFFLSIMLVESKSLFVNF